MNCTCQNALELIVSNTETVHELPVQRASPYWEPSYLIVILTDGTHLNRSAIFKLETSFICHMMFLNVIAVSVSQLDWALLVCGQPRTGKTWNQNSTWYNTHRL